MFFFNRMFQAKVVKPLVGKWAADALREVNIDYLEEFCPNQEAGDNRAEAARIWYRMGAALKLYPDNVLSWDLRKVQEFIARTPPHLRCPCARGVKLEKWEDHYNKCNLKAGLGMLEREKEAFKRKLEKDVEDREAIEEADRKQAAQMKVLEGQWDESQVSHMSTAFLQKMQRLARQELSKRCDDS